MQFHNLKRVHPNKRSVSVGRGGKRGKTSGRGGKGQTARSGHKVRPEIRDIIKKIPKLRGRGKNINTSIETKPVVINISALESKFNAGDAVTVAVLFEKGLVKKSSGILPQVKVLGDGVLTKKLSISGVTVSKSAKEAIVKAGGKVN